MSTISEETEYFDSDENVLPVKTTRKLLDKNEKKKEKKKER